MKGIIRDIKPGDLGWIISMHGMIYSQEFKFDTDFEISIATKLVNFYEKKISSDSLWIIEIDGVRAGSIAVSKLSVQIAFINFLLVLNQFRGQGIGRVLMNKAIHHARDHDFSTLQLETYSCLQQARKLYNTLGFRMINSTKNICKFGHVFDQEFWELRL